ncbi:ATP-grasp domain-containing protein [Paramicrobacterium agarici]|uniref:Carbamoyl-phosphate synthase large subunit n=1 Tax=Paramicrobacterium agarici TaxID=630514 RepID=A0A2A9DXL3_9MICO|nr:ATP-grasp domain-containing protein [Microbacterium agarici]PFG30670.1 carbamoyl-phosphate synthase large subunit [Microbacterium agarici]
MREDSAQQPMRILIGSVGRRVYLVDWFEQAFTKLGVNGEVHVTDADPFSAAYARASFRHLMPEYGEPGYENAMISLFKKIRPNLFFSVNDFELAYLASTRFAIRLRQFGGNVLALPEERHRAVHDKYQMAIELAAVGVSTPDTALLSDTAGVEAVLESSTEVVIKDRFGSGSSGLVIARTADFDSAVKWLSVKWRKEIERHKRAAEFVVQRAIIGEEYGMDLVSPLEEGVHPLGVLARRKSRMRSGETDRAESVDASPFVELAQAVASWTGHQGLIDVDVMVAQDGRPFVIDINPRFGGGYPFSHLAGADVPSLYVAQLLQGSCRRLDAKGHLSYVPGVVSTKNEAVTKTSVR